MERPFTMIYNDYFDWLLSASAIMTKREIRVMLCVIRNTAGFNRKTARLSSRYVADLTGMDRSNVSKALRGAESKGFIAVEKKGQVLFVTLLDKIKDEDQDKTGVNTTPDAEINRGQSDPASGVNLTPPPGSIQPRTGVNLTPKKERTKEREEKKKEKKGGSEERSHHDKYKDLDWLQEF